MPFLGEIAQRLVDDGVGVLGTNMFLSSQAIIPPGDGPYMVITETGGSGPTRTQNVRRSTQRPTAQISVRAESYPIARAMSKAAYESLDGIFNETLSGTFYLSITARQEPTDTGHDDPGRAVVVFNINAEKAPS